MAKLPFGDVAHLLRRSGFAARAADVEALRDLTWSQAVDRVLDVSGAPSPTAGLPDLSPGRDSWSKYTDMTQFWANRAATSPTPVVEKMTLFWHGLLPTSLDKVFDHPQLMAQNTLYRAAGMGSIRDLYQAMAVQPAMLRYLDNADNVASAPNENFARELMELFLLGVGQYSEEDVRTSALAWSGHILDDSEQHYVFDNSKHHQLPATFMGTTKVWNGPEIIDHLILGPKQVPVSQFLSRKLWNFFAYPNPDQAVVDSIASSMRTGGMRADAALRAIFNHPEFRSVRARQGLVRSPFEFFVAVMAHTGQPANVVHPEWFAADMGQAVFRPPNVSGWRQNRYWISSASAWAKLRFADYVRWKLEQAALLPNSKNLPVEQAVQDALELFGLYEPSAHTVASLRQYVSAERSARGWGERVGLLMLPILTPDFQVA
jgi:uncharacterized protein (DUF1800 family)